MPTALQLHTKRATSVFLIAIAAGCALASNRGSAQEREKAAEKSEPRSVPFIVRATSCEQCHAQPNKYNAEDVICRMNESLTWDRNDKHRKAFAVLQTPRAEQMGKLLGVDVATHRACLSCHSDIEAVLPASGGGQGPTITKWQDDLRQEGVGCVACHGAKRDWIRDHTDFDNPQWRRLSREEKEQRSGMVDLWDPVTRAKKCSSCHIGNIAEGKVLTHAMYAAGHPALPGLEVLTFTKAMPAHWEFLREKQARLSTKKPAVQESLKRTLPLGQLDHSALVAASGLVTLRDSLDLFLHQAEQGGSVQEPKTVWPDYARFDCQACHHDLKLPSWRQVRGFQGAPGRPPLPDWPTALVALSLDVASHDKAPAQLKEFHRRLTDLHTDLSAQPFGDKRRAAETAEKLVSWLDERLSELRNKPVDRPMALRALKQLGEAGRSPILDYDSARQLYWAYRGIYDELEPKPRTGDPTIAALDRLDKDLGFSLPSSGVQEPIEKTLAARLRSVSLFDPFAFQDRWTELVSLALPAK